MRFLFGLVVLIFLNSVNVAAEETEYITPEPIVQSAMAATSLADHSNFIGIGFRVADFRGIYLSYAKPVHTHWFIGTQVSYGVRNRHHDYNNGLFVGDWDFYQETSLMADLNATYYFRGFGKWGPILRAGIGYSYHTAKAQWGEDDPAWIWSSSWFDMSKDAKETYKDNWYSGYGRAGLAYQLVWGFNSGSRTGHVFEIGVTGSQFLKQNTLIHRRSDNTWATTKSASVITAFELGYTIAF